MQPPAPSSTSLTIWKISQVRLHVFFLSTNTILSTNKEQPHSHLSPVPRAWKESFPKESVCCSLDHIYDTQKRNCNRGLQSVSFIPSVFTAWERLWRLLWAKKPNTSFICPTVTTILLSQTTQKLLSSSQAQQPRSLQSTSGVIQWRWSHWNRANECGAIQRHSTETGVSFDPLNSSPCPGENAHMHHWRPSSFCLRALIFSPAYSLPGI